MKNAPCARLGIRIRPKISEKPDDNRNSRPPKATLFSVWMIQNCHCIDGSLSPGECLFSQAWRFFLLLQLRKEVGEGAEASPARASLAPSRRVSRPSGLHCS